MDIEKIRKICVTAFIVVGLALIYVEKANAPKEYTGSAEGFAGAINVTVMAKKHGQHKIRISDVKYTHEDTEAIADPAINEVISKLKETQDISKVDAVAGATYSSQGVIMAIKDALSKME